MDWNEAVKRLVNEVPYEENAVVIRVVQTFEPFGRATETWETVWYLDLPHVPYHWYSTSGWRLGTAGRGMHFSGHTEEQAQAQAAAFLTWWFAQGKADYER